MNTFLHFLVYPFWSKVLALNNNKDAVAEEIIVPGFETEDDGLRADGGISRKIYIMKVLGVGKPKHITVAITMF